MNGLSKETLELIQQTAQQAARGEGKIAIVPIPGSRVGRCVIVKPDGSYESSVADNVPLSLELLSVSQIGQVISEFESGGSTIWYAPSGVTVILNEESDSPRDDRAVCPLRHTDEFQFVLSELAPGRQYDQKALLSVIRRRLWLALGDVAPRLLECLRKLTFATVDSGHGEVGIGRQSYGKDIKGDIESLAGDLAQFEQLTLNVRLYDDPALTVRRPIRCILEDDPLSRTFQLVPLAGEIKRALDEEMDHVAVVLADAGANIYYGCPGGGGVINAC